METNPETGTRGGLGLGTGIGLVIANMVGAGVFLSTGFMAQELTAIQILAAWGVGSVIALSGAVAYAGVALLVPRSGGEYRYLSTLGHPFLGYWAGWASLLVGFAGPIAVDAAAAGIFVQRVWPSVNAQWVGALIIIGLAAFHAFDRTVSKSAQNAMVIVKVAFLIGFVALGVLFGDSALPAWRPPTLVSGFPWGPFAGSLFFIAFAFSGWNAAVYASEEFERPKQQVPRSMLIGCLAVAITYLLVNWVLVANITPESASVVFQYESERVTLAHVVANKLGGPSAARFVSGALALALVSAASAMTLVGPRVYVAMARDGFLPRPLAGTTDRPPLFSTALQAALALFIFFTHRVHEILQNVGAVLTIFSALTALCLFKVYFFRKDLPKPSKRSLAAAAIYALAACWMFYEGLRHATTFWTWSAAFLGCAGVAYWITKRATAARV